MFVEDEYAPERPVSNPICYKHVTPTGLGLLLRLK